MITGQMYNCVARKSTIVLPKSYQLFTDGNQSAKLFVPVGVLKSSLQLQAQAIMAMLFASTVNPPLQF